MKKFTLEINLDDEVECETFIKLHGTQKGQGLANRLGFKGKGAWDAADALMNYAWNKKTAIGLRKKGEIETAQKYESICDKIYSRDIQPNIECW